MKYGKIILFLINILSFIKKTYEQESFDPAINTKSIIINDKIVYIINSADNYDIKINQEIKGNYSISFKNNKDIIKQCDSNFIIIGLDANNYLSFQKFILEDDNVQTGTFITSTLYLNPIYNFETKYIKNNEFIVYTHTSNKFNCYFIDLTQSNPIIATNEVANIPNNAVETFIKCDSFDAINFFCIYYYKVSDSWLFNYSYGNSLNKITGSICTDIWSYGNVIKVNYKREKYLVCYVKIESSNIIIDTICQYYYYENGNINLENNINLRKDSGQTFVTKPIILYQYKNSLFIQFYIKNYHFSS